MTLLNPAVDFNFSGVLYNFDLQKFFDVMDDYFQAVRITSQKEWEKNLIPSLGIDLWQVLAEAGYDIVIRAETAIKSEEEPGRILLEAEVPERISNAAHRVRSILEHDILQIAHPYYFGISGKIRGMLLGDIEEDEKFFLALVNDLGKLVAEEIASSIRIKEMGDMLGSTLIYAVTDDYDRALNAVKRKCPSNKVTVKQLAEMHNVNISTARRWCEKGQIEAEKNGRDWFLSESVARIFKPPKAGRPKKR